jgi:chromosome segregation ATPase
MMENGFDLLEEKVRRTVDLVKRLRKENKALDEDLARARARLDQAQKALESLERERGAQSAQSGHLESLGKELKVLRQEREEVRGRIAKLVEALNGLD